MDVEQDTTSSSSSRLWRFLGKNVPRSEITFLSQVIILYIVIITCIVNLSIGAGNNELWVSLLSYSLGCILPSPKIKRALSTSNNA